MDNWPISYNKRKGQEKVTSSVLDPRWELSPTKLSIFHCLLQPAKFLGLNSWIRRQPVSGFSPSSAVVSLIHVVIGAWEPSLELCCVLGCLCVWLAQGWKGASSVLELSECSHYPDCMFSVITRPYDPMCSISAEIHLIFYWAKNANASHLRHKHVHC